jgi:hypothetical protein
MTWGEMYFLVCMWHVICSDMALPDLVVWQGFEQAPRPVCI